MQKYLKTFESILYWGILVLIFFIPLYQKFPLTILKGSFVAIRLEDFIFAFIYMVWLFYLVASKKIITIFKDKLFQAILVFFLVGFVSLVSAVLISHTVIFKIGIFHFLRRVELILLLPLLLTSIKNSRQIYFYLASISLAVFITNLFALGQRFLHFPVVSTINSELSKGFVYYMGVNDRVNSTFAGHYDLAVFLMMFISVAPTLLYYFTSKKKNKSHFDTAAFIWLAILLFLSLLVLVMTAARLSFIAAAMGIFVSLLLIGKKKYLIYLFIAVLIVLAYPSTLRDRFISTFTVNIHQDWQRYFGVSDEQRKRSELNIPTLPTVSEQETKPSGTESADIVPGEPTNVTQLGVYRSFAIRTQVEWPRAIRGFLRNPLLGSGYSSIDLATDNDLLRSLGETGILGTYSFLLVVYLLIKRLWLRFKREVGFFKYLAGGVLAAVLAFVVNSLFIDVFEASKVASMFWLISGLGLAVPRKN